LLAIAPPSQGSEPPAKPERFKSIVLIRSIPEVLNGRYYGLSLLRYYTAALCHCHLLAAAIQPQEFVLDALKDIKWLVVNAVGEELNDLHRIIENNCDQIVTSAVHRTAGRAAERLLRQQLLG
jgi:hypothetical protein